MKTLIKFVLAAIALVVVVVVGLLAWAMLALDPNSYKPQLEQAARNQGVELDIAGDLGWSLWPNLAITLGETRFAGEDHGLQPSSLREAHLVLSWGDLLRRRIAVRALTVDGADLHLTSTDSGAIIAATPATGDEPVEAGAPDGQPFTLAVDEFAIRDSSLRLEQDGSTLLLDDINLKTRDVNMRGEPFPVEMRFRFHPEDGDPLSVALDTRARYHQDEEKLDLADSVIQVGGLLPGDLRLSLKAAVDLAAETVALDNLRIDLADTRFTGSAILGYGEPMRLDLDLAGTDFDLDSLLESLPAADQAETDEVNLLAPLLLPLALLDGGSGRFDLRLDNLVAGGMALANPTLKVHVRDQVLTLEEVSSGLFGGTLHGDGAIDARGATPTLRFSGRLAAIDLEQALDHLAEDLDFSGILTMAIQGISRGDDGDALMANLDAAGNLQVTNPHLGKVNVEQAYCELAALVEQKGGRQDPWPEGTRLNDVASDFRIHNQVLHLDNYSTGIGNLGLRGNGVIDLEQQSFDIRAITRLTGDRTSDDGCEVRSSRVRDRDIPFVCRDTFASAGATSCRPDQDFVRGLLQNEVLDRVLGGDEEEGRSIEDRLRGLFRR